MAKLWNLTPERNEVIAKKSIGKKNEDEWVNYDPTSKQNPLQVGETMTILNRLNRAAEQVETVEKTGEKTKIKDSCQAPWFPQEQNSIVIF